MNNIYIPNGLNSEKEYRDYIQEYDLFLENIKLRDIKMTIEEEWDLFSGEAVGKRCTTEYGEKYLVKGTYMDSNGCLKTYGEGKESFILDSKYN
jgi:hypothetical protein